jgi:hypothetical protein
MKMDKFNQGMNTSKSDNILCKLKMNSKSQRRLKLSLAMLFQRASTCIFTIRN